jgi:hypothetical protein
MSGFRLAAFSTVLLWAGRETGPWSRPNSRAPGAWSWRNDAGAGFAKFARYGRHSGPYCPARRCAPARCPGYYRARPQRARPQKDGRPVRPKPRRRRSAHCVLFIDLFIDPGQPAVDRLARRHPVPAQAGGGKRFCQARFCNVSQTRYPCLLLQQGKSAGSRGPHHPSSRSGQDRDLAPARRVASLLSAPEV